MLLKDLLEPERTKFTNIWLQYKINVCIDQLDNTVNKYNITCDSTIKIKSVDVKIIKYLDFCIENNDKDPKFKVGDDVRILILFFFFQIRSKWEWRSFCD